MGLIKCPQASGKCAGQSVTAGRKICLPSTALSLGRSFFSPFGSFFFLLLRRSSPSPPPARVMIGRVAHIILLASHPHVARCCCGLSSSDLSSQSLYSSFLPSLPLRSFPFILLSHSAAAAEMGLAAAAASSFRPSVLYPLRVGQTKERMSCSSSLPVLAFWPFLPFSFSRRKFFGFKVQATFSFAAVVGCRSSVSRLIRPELVNSHESRSNSTKYPQTAR